MQTERQAYNKNKKKIIETVTNLKDNQFLRIRKCCPRESLRLMGISESHIDRMLNPRGYLESQGYSEEEIDKMLIKETGEENIYKQAGNSIVVDVLYHLFRKMFIEPGVEVGQDEQLF